MESPGRPRSRAVQIQMKYVARNTGKGAFLRTGRLISLLTIWGSSATWVLSLPCLSANQDLLDSLISPNLVVTTSCTNAVHLLPEA